ncbi:MAG: hypothetical protein LUH50_20935 [Bacteroides intestinalis]|nr:hypothetical protein [Bacteroides intestinalis]
MTLIIITGEKVDDKCINEPRYPFLAIQQAKQLIDNMLIQKQEILQKYSNSSDVVSCLYYYGSSKGICVRIYQNDLNHEITIDQAFGDWNRSLTFLDSILDE